LTPKSRTSTSEFEKPKGKRARLLEFIRNRFLAGVIVITPIAIVVFSILFMFRQIDHVLGEHIQAPISYVLSQWDVTAKFAETLAQPISIALSTLIIIAIIVFIGAISRFLLVRRLIGIGESIISRVPLIRFFYQTPKEVIKIFTEQKNSVKRVVMVQYPKENTWAMAYVTGEMLHGPDQKRMVTVFIPTTPNPTSGFMLMYPAEEVLDMNITTEDAIRMIISGGILSPEIYHTTTFAGLDRIPDLPPAVPLTSGDEHLIVSSEEINEAHEKDKKDNTDGKDDTKDQ